ncbi:hypothetical protein PG995_014688 [Apiospora arundinis]
MISEQPKVLVLPSVLENQQYHHGASLALLNLPSLAASHHKVPPRRLACARQRIPVLGLVPPPLLLQLFLLLAPPPRPAAVAHDVLLRERLPQGLEPDRLFPPAPRRLVADRGEGRHARRVDALDRAYEV